MVRTKYPLFKWMHRGQRGFTLVELLVVIAILGVIAAVAIPNITRFMGSGEEEAQAAELHNVLVAVSAAMAKSIYPNHACFTFGGTGIAANSTADNASASKYLLNKTTWKYVVASDGTTTRPTTDKATTWETGAEPTT